MCVTLSSQDTEVCSFCRGPPPLLLTNPGHLLHPLHTSLVCSALTFQPDSHLSACHGFPPIARNPSLFPLSHLTFPTPQPSTTVKISSLPSRLAVTASCPGRKAQVGAALRSAWSLLVEVSLATTPRPPGAQLSALDGTEDHSIPAQ